MFIQVTQFNASHRGRLLNYKPIILNCVFIYDFFMILSYQLQLNIKQIHCFQLTTELNNFVIYIRFCISWNLCIMLFNLGVNSHRDEMS